MHKTCTIYGYKLHL